MPTDVMADRLLHERNTVESKIRTIEQIATDENGRDLRGDELESIKTYTQRLRDIDSQLAVVTERTAMEDGLAEKIATYTSPNTNVVGHQYTRASDLLWDISHQGDVEARMRYANAQKRAAQHMGTTAEQTVAVAGGFGGLWVAGPTGPVINLTPRGRPWLSAIGVRQAPGFSFLRPRLVDPDFLTAAQVQALQKQEVSSKKFDIVADTLQLKTYANYLNLSIQAESFVNGSLDITVNQLLARVAVAQEQALATEAALTNSSVTLAADADGAAVRAAIFEASALVYDQTGQLATWVAMGPQGWARLGSLVDLAGRPLFPLGPGVNAEGSMSPSTFTIAGLGLSAVVTPGITDGTFYVGNELGVEAYEYRFPVLSAVEPSVLGRQIAVGSALALYRPTTKESTDGGVTPGEGNGIVKIEAGGAAARRTSTTSK